MASNHGNGSNAPLDDHGDLDGLADDDHSQYALLAGRTGGQYLRGGDGANDTLQLRGSTAATLSNIEVESPLDFGDTTLNTANPYLISAKAASTVSSPAAIGGIDMQPQIAMDNAVFFYVGMQASPSITSNVAPTFASFILFQATPSLISGLDAPDNPLSALILNGGPRFTHNATGNRTVATCSIVNAQPFFQGNSAGSLAITSSWGLNFNPFVSGSVDIDLGTQIGLFCGNPGPPPLGSYSGTGSMTAYIGVDVDPITFGGDITKRALRSALTAASNTLMIENTGGADSDFGDGDLHFNDDAGLVFGDGDDITLSWGHSPDGLTMDSSGSTYGLRFSALSDKWTLQTAQTGTLGTVINIDSEKVGICAAALINSAVTIGSTDLRRAAVGDWHDVSVSSTARLTTLSSAALTTVSKMRIDAIEYDGLNPPGSIDDETNLLIERHSTFDSDRKSSLWVQGRSRLDGALNFDAVSPAQITTDEDDYSLPAHPNEAFIIRLDTDGNHTISGFDIDVDDEAEVDDAYMLVNIGSNDVILGHQDTGSAAENRIISPTGADYTLNSDETCLIWYDDDTSRWRILNGTGT